jgi:cytochrome c peroxidase
MGRIQLGAKISDKEAASIEEFLKSLEGQKPKIIYPVLPNETPTTPKPQID